MANTCEKALGLYLLVLNQCNLVILWGIIITYRSAAMCYIFQVSALSAFDGSVLDYHGYNG